jgi:hypothetical protein
MTQEQENEMLIRLRRLIDRIARMQNVRGFPWKRVLIDLLDACGVRMACDIPPKVVPFAEQYYDRVVKDYGLPEV